MFTSKFFQTLLLSLTCLGLFLLYQFQLAKFQQASRSQLITYQNQISQIKDWPQSGYEIYQTVKAISPLRFFQYVAKVETDNNYTTGQLLNDDTIIINRLFPDNTGTYTKIPNGRIQIKLDLSATKSVVVSDFINISLIILSTYIFIALWAQLCFSRFNSYLSQITQLVGQIPSRKSTINSNTRFPKQFKAIEQAITQAKESYVERIKRITLENQQLNKEARQDQLTGLLTRLVFFKKLEESASSKQQINGSIIVLRASELSYINQFQGRNAGDAYLVKISKLLLAITKTTPNCSHFRISSAEFAIVLPEVNFKSAEILLPKIKSLLDEYQQVIRTQSIAHIGLIPYKNEIPPTTLLGMIEGSVSVAETLGANSFFAMAKPKSDESLGDSNWRDTLNFILKNGSATFYHQPIQSCNTQKAFYQELLTRFENEDRRVLTTATVVSMAERHDIIIELDKMLISKAIRLLISRPQLRNAIGINISSVSALNKSFQAWLLNQLKQHSNVASKLVLEVDEMGMHANVAAAANFVKQVHKSSARVCFEHFGTGFTAFKFLKEVRPDFIKLDNSFTKDIHFNEDNRFIVRMLVDIAKRLNIPVIATSIESQAEKIEFEQLLVDGLQGFFISTPKILKAA
ncbi:EAL domain-containing protein [Parashewanella tropica]|uniref:EAL domain-containing protein n=1 Tax=Parashewanella tropica TaxID=2547970 RepID=UPI001478F378|nr:GGDEF domain-containing protein [Parashewanella tropica]